MAYVVKSHGPIGPDTLKRHMAPAIIGPFTVLYKAYVYRTKSTLLYTVIPC